MERHEEVAKIREHFKKVKSDPVMGEREKTTEYRNLMNKMESKFGSFILFPTDAELNRDDVILYKEISDARVF